MQYVMKQPTTTSINASITLHGVTRSKELIDSFHKLGMGISYSNVLILRDAWTLHDLDSCSVCPDAIAEGQPSISIIDNDDFHSDTLTGGGTSHRCNWMFLQRLEQQLLEYNANVQELHSRTKDVKTMSLALSEKVSEMQPMTPYKSTKHGEPRIRPEPAAFSASTEPQRKRSIINALVRVNTNGDRPEVAEQTISSYNSFHTGLSSELRKSKAYFHMSYNQPPSKSVVNDIMNKLTTIIATKHMPFAFLVGDLPVYVLIVT